MKKIVIFIVLALGISGLRASIAEEKNMSNLAKATFAGGCFWCMEGPFDRIEGVKETISGYTGGQEKNPTYREVASGQTGHAEAVEILYDPMVVSYENLLDVFWRNINPTSKNRQFADVGSQYRSAIFYHNEEQKRLAEASKKALQETGIFKQPIVTEITPASTFYRAEEYHQDYYIKEPVHYKRYRVGSGRESFLKSIWGTSEGKK